MKGQDYSLLSMLLGLGRAGRIFYTTIFVLAVPSLLAWFVILPGLQFHDEDERLFRAARHGDRAGVERSLASGGRVNGASPIDGKTALFRAAVFGHAEVVRVLLEHGADPAARGSDGRSALEVAQAARAEEKNPAVAAALDGVVSVLREAKGQR